MGKFGEACIVNCCMPNWCLILIVTKVFELAAFIVVFVAIYSLVVSHLFTAQAESIVETCEAVCQNTMSSCNLRDAFQTVFNSFETITDVFDKDYIVLPAITARQRRDSPT